VWHRADSRRRPAGSARGCRTRPGAAGVPQTAVRRVGVCGHYAERPSAVLLCVFRLGRGCLVWHARAGHTPRSPPAATTAARPGQEPGRRAEAPPSVPTSPRAYACARTSLRRSHLVLGHHPPGRWGTRTVCIFRVKVALISGARSGPEGHRRSRPTWRQEQRRRSPLTTLQGERSALQRHGKFHTSAASDPLPSWRMPTVRSAGVGPLWTPRRGA